MVRTGPLETWAAPRWLKISGIALTCGAVLVIGSYYRFARMAEQGLPAGDTVKYYQAAKNWAAGQTDFLNEAFYRPVVYALNALAIITFGDTDYSIRAMNGVLDVACLGLIILAGWQLTGSFVPGIAAALVYAMMPYAIYFCRSGMPHTISALLVVIAFCLFRPRWVPGSGSNPRLVFDAAAGVTLSLAANTHSELGFLGLGFVACQTLQATRSGFGRSDLLWLLKRAAATTIGFAAVYIIGFALFGFRRAWDVLLHEVRAHTGTPAYIADSPLYRVPFDIFRVSSEAAFYGDGFWFPLMVLISVAALWSQFFRTARFREAGAFLPLMILLAYIVAFPVTVGAFDKSHARLFLPLIPLVLLATTTGLYFLGDAFFGRWRIAPLIAAMIAMLALAPQAVGEGGYFANPNWYKKELARTAYDALGDRVDNNHKLLILPSTAYYSRSFQLGFYFGPNAEFLADQPRSSAYTPELLFDITRTKRFRYVLIHPFRDLRVWDPTFPSALRTKSWFLAEPYNPLTEDELLYAFLNQYAAHALPSIGNAHVYTLRKKPLFPNSEFATGNLDGWHELMTKSTLGIVETQSVPVPSRFRINTIVKRRRASNQLSTEMTIELRSIPFVITHDIVGFVIAGTHDPTRIHVGLQVSGTELRAAPQNLTMQRGEWSVEDFVGQRAVLFVRDLDPNPNRGVIVGGFYYVY
jgi:hypothetical protein